MALGTQSLEDRAAADREAFLPKIERHGSGLRERDEDEETGRFSFEEEDGSGRQGKGSAKGWWKEWLRLGVEVLMGVAIVALFLGVDVDTEGMGEGGKTAVPTFPKVDTTFLGNSTFLNEEMWESHEKTMAVLHNWIPLSSDGRGYVQIEEDLMKGLGEPYTIAKPHSQDTEDVYMVSVFHQLHCLSYLIQHYQLGYSGRTLDHEVAHHSTHCFGYLRQGIMCNADTSLEGKTEAGPGWGSRHQCVDYEKLLEWANERTVVKWKTNIPGGL